MHECSDKVGTHSTRQTLARKVFPWSQDIRLVQRIIGQKNLQSTEASLLTRAMIFMAPIACKPGIEAVSQPIEGKILMSGSGGKILRHQQLGDEGTPVNPSPDDQPSRSGFSIRTDARLDTMTRAKVDDLAKRFRKPRAAVLSYILQ
jgi:hypothetical protein